MAYRIERDEGFIDDLQRWASSDRSLSDEMVSRIEAIEDDPFKGEWKPGGPIRGCRGESFRGGRFTIVYELRPDDPVQRDLDRVEEVDFMGITKHDNQAEAGISADSPIDAMFHFEIEVPATDGNQTRAALYGLDHVYPDDDSESWANDQLSLSGQFERAARDGFHSIVDSSWIIREERRSIEDFLLEP